MKKTKRNCDHYSWGGNCSGWHLVKTGHLSIIQESMPPNTWVQRHFHNFAQQFFFILSGRALLYLDEEVLSVEPGEGVHIQPQTKHHIRNNSSENLDFLVISQPPAQQDRFDTPLKDPL